jgi:hypothetical protein
MMASIRIKKLLKLAQEGNLEAWQAVKAEAENPELPPGMIDEAVVESAVEVGEDLTRKGKEAETAVKSMTPEDKKELRMLLNDRKFKELTSDMSGKMTASAMIDLMLIKQASKYISKNDAIELVREINIYQNLHGSGVKIASSNSLERVLFEKEAAFDLMLSDESHSVRSSFLKISQKYSGKITKEGGSLWQSAKDIGSAALDLGSKAVGGGGKTLSYVGRGIKSSFRLLFKWMPVIGIALSAYFAIDYFKKQKKAFDSAKKLFSEFGDDNNLLDAEHISELVSTFKDDPEKMLKITQLNKLAKYYKDKCLNMWYSVSDIIFNIIETIGLVATVAGTIASGGWAALFFWVIPLIAGLIGAGASVATTFFDYGLEAFTENTTKILSFCGEKIEQLSGSSDEGISEDVMRLVS